MSETEGDSEALRRRADRREQIISWHAATNKDKCYEMQRKYGWTLLNVRPNKDSTFKVKCIFEGETEFPNYQED